MKFMDILFSQGGRHGALCRCIAATS